MRELIVQPAYYSGQGYATGENLINAAYAHYKQITDELMKTSVGKHFEQAMEYINDLVQNNVALESALWNLKGVKKLALKLTITATAVYFLQEMLQNSMERIQQNHPNYYRYLNRGFMTGRKCFEVALQALNVVRKIVYLPVQLPFIAAFTVLPFVLTSSAMWTSVSGYLINRTIYKLLCNNYENSLPKNSTISINDHFFRGYKEIKPDPVKHNET